ncbi:MAG: HAD family phosphatase [Kiritimatiellae bacterium]|nr:HAD family phosphatase [Kiritimatiellia bacterium]MDW8457567.1 HAD family phosphatase [Verrucomicrobiota bacterium]
MLKAVVFDFDGIIVDTEALHFEALNRVLEPMGLGFSWDVYVRDFIGNDDRGVFEAVLRQAGHPITEEEVRRLVSRKAATFHHMVSSEPPRPFPDTLALIRRLRGRLPLALCTGALRSDLEPIFGQLDLHDAFDAVVTADDVSASKPDPACYRLAVRRLSEARNIELEPPDCLAIEDTPTGIAAAKAARLRVLAVTNTHEAKELGAADAILNTLDGLDIEDLHRVAGRAAG